jgi:Relaxase/Mobilisation nuclease domain
MVIKGVSCAGAARLATHLTRTDTNETVKVTELRGVAAEDLRGALLEMEAVGAGARTTKPFYHGSINTGIDERLTDEQRVHAINRLEEKLGLSGQSRVVVVHEKKGREHCHIVWSRIDLDRMAAVSDSHNYRKHEQVARDLEREFGHERVQGAHIEREGRPRPKRTPSHVEMLQVERGAVRPEEAKALVTDLWQRADSGQSFKQALEERDWLLARGDRRDFVVIDPGGGTHSLARRVEGAKAKDIRAGMADVDPESLPSVAEARATQRERQRLAALENPPDERAASTSKARKVDEKATLGPLEWTDRGGMVAQQQSATDLLRRIARTAPAAQGVAPPVPQPDQSAKAVKSAAAPSGTQAGEFGLMADFVTEETKKKAAEEEALRANDPNKDRDRGGRGRSR